MADSPVIAKYAGHVRQKAQTLPDKMSGRGRVNIFFDAYFVLGCKSIFDGEHHIDHNGRDSDNTRQTKA